MLSPVRLSSVCLSVTFLRRTQPVEIFGNVSTALGTLAIQRHPRKNLRRSSQGNLSVAGVKRKRGSHIAILDLSKVISRKHCKIGGKLVLITNRKSHMSFRLAPKSVTLNGVMVLILRYFTEFGSFRGALSKSG